MAESKTNRIHKSASNLTSLFSSTLPGSNNDDESSGSALFYKAPIQPKARSLTAPDETDPEPKPQPAAENPQPQQRTLLYSCAARLWKYAPLSKNEPEVVGDGAMLGCVIMPMGVWQYSLLLYDQAKVPQLQMEITATFDFSLMNNNYVQIQESQAVRWLILLPSPQAQTDFALHLGIASIHRKWLQGRASQTEGADRPPEISKADVALGSVESTALGEGDTAGLVYTVWEMTATMEVNAKSIMESDPVVKIDSQNVYKAKIGTSGKAEVCGFQLDVKGMKKRGKRIFSIPSAIPRPEDMNTKGWLLILVEIMKVKFAKTIPSQVQEKVLVQKATSQAEDKPLEQKNAEITENSNESLVNEAASKDDSPVEESDPKEEETKVVPQEADPQLPEQEKENSSPEQKPLKTIKERMAAISAAGGYNLPPALGALSLEQSQLPSQNGALPLEHSQLLSDDSKIAVTEDSSNGDDLQPRPLLASPDVLSDIDDPPSESSGKQEVEVELTNCEVANPSTEKDVTNEQNNLHVMYQTAETVKDIYKTLEDVKSMLVDGTFNTVCKNSQSGGIDHLNISSSTAEHLAESGSFLNLFKSFLERHEHLEKHSRQLEKQNDALQLRLDDLQQKNMELLSQKNADLEKQRAYLEKIAEHREREISLLDEIKLLKCTKDQKLLQSTQNFFEQTANKDADECDQNDNCNETAEIDDRKMRDQI